MADNKIGKKGVEVLSKMLEGNSCLKLLDLHSKHPWSQVHYGTEREREGERDVIRYAYCVRAYAVVYGDTIMIDEAVWVEL